MTGAIQMIFFDDFFGEEMSEISDLAMSSRREGGGGEGGRVKMTEGTQTIFFRHFGFSEA